MNMSVKLTNYICSKLRQCSEELKVNSENMYARGQFGAYMNVLSQCKELDDEEISMMEYFYNKDHEEVSR